MLGAGATPELLSHLLTCTGVVVDFISRRPHVADLALAFHDAQLLLRGPRARHPHSWARLGLELYQEWGSGLLVVPKHPGTSSSPLPPHSRPPGTWARADARWVPEALVCLVDQEHIPFPPPLGAWGSPWGSTEVASRGLGSTQSQAHLTFSKCWSSKEILAVPDCRTPEP